MPYIKSIFFLLFFSSILISCGESKKTEQEYLDAAKAQYDNQQYDQAIESYRALITNYPQSDKAIHAYNQIAGIYFQDLKNYEKAVETYREIAANYPDTKDAKQSLFMVAFIYDETVQDKQKAMDAYRAFLEKYPEDTDPGDKMSESAMMMLQFLESGKSPEELIQERIGNMDLEKDKTNVTDADKNKPKAEDNVKIEKVEEDKKE
jgi:tetratricopeptide (TPR) repeat protein